MFNPTPIYQDFIIVQEEEPTSPFNGQIWVKTPDGATFQYFNGNWEQIGQEPDGETILENEEGNLKVNLLSPKLSKFTYDGIEFDPTSESSSPYGLYFNPEGTKMFILCAGSESVYQYTLTESFDISTASYDGIEFDVNSEAPTPYGLYFNPEGTKMYITDFDSDSVYQYTLTESFDISTATYDDIQFDASTEVSSPIKIFINPEGTKMYITDNSSEAVYQYTLSESFDISTASYDDIEFDVSSESTNPRGIFFNSEGTKMYITGDTSESVYQYTLTESFDISTASYDDIEFDVNSEAPDPIGLYFNPEGTKMYILDSDSESVYQYSGNKIPVWEV